MNDTLLPGGYVALTTAQLWNLCSLTADKKLSLAALKLFLAASEMIERRCKARKTPFYGLHEMQSLTGLTLRTVRDGLRELNQIRLLEFSENAVTLLPQEPLNAKQQPFDTNPGRIVPIPRRLMRILCAHSRKSEIVVALTHLARGLFKLGNRVVMKGAVRASWITDVFGIGKTTIHSTRAWLRSLGFMKDQDDVAQWRRNRFGYYFEILVGSYPHRKKRESTKHTLSGGPYKRTPFNKLKLTSTRARPVSATGSFTRNFSSKGPDIRDIRIGDLRRVSSLLVLFRQATARGIIERNTAAFQNFVGAAVRSLNQAKNPPAFFIALIRNRHYWKHITHVEERRALDAINRYRAKQEKLATKEAEPVRAENKARVAALVRTVELPNVPYAYVGDQA